MLFKHLYVHVEKIIQARLHPGLYLCIAMDATDQVKFGIPQYRELTKLDGKLRLRSHLMICVRDSGEGRNIDIYDTADNIFHDSNLTIECLHRSLLRHQQLHGGLPECLNLQMDNCVRENKNAYLFAFLAWLVERKVFRRVYISFLPVGHTHFICDQVASRISVAVKHNDFYTRGEFHNLVRKCTSPRPFVEQVHYVTDCKGMMNPERDDNFRGSSISRPSGLTGPLHFRFELDGDHAVIKVKKNASQEVWSHPYNIFEREGDDGKIVHTSGFDFADIGAAAFKEVAIDKLNLIKKNLDRCRVRSGEEAYADQIREYNRLVGLPTGPEIPFDWANGGLYEPELSGTLREPEGTNVVSFLIICSLYLR